MSYKVNILFNRDENGYFVYCPDLPGCHSQGDTFEEALINIKEATQLYISTIAEETIKSKLYKKYNKHFKKLEIILGIKEGIKKIKEAKKSGTNFQTLGSFLKETKG